jgi:hypothetical protein
LKTAKDIWQLRWIDDATGNQKKYRSMIVGWQNSLSAINTLVSAFNDLYLAKGAKQNAHHIMKEIAVKKLIVAWLFEIKDTLYDWFAVLRKDGIVTPDLESRKRALKQVLKPVDQFKDIRNSVAFHVGDLRLPPNELIDMYLRIEALDLNSLNKILRSAENFGQALKKHLSTYAA